MAYRERESLIVSYDDALAEPQAVFLRLVGFAAGRRHDAADTEPSFDKMTAMIRTMHVGRTTALRGAIPVYVNESFCSLAAVDYALSSVLKLGLHANAVAALDDPVLASLGANPIYPMAKRGSESRSA